MRKHPHGPLVIGWREIISLPEWGIAQLLAKSDTGAKGSAIDARKITELEDGRIRFEIVVKRGARPQTQMVEADVIGKARVKSSNGQVQSRYKVSTTLRIGGVEKQVEFTLVNRRNMLCRALLGRTALAHDFLVDSESSYLFGKRKRGRKTKATAAERKSHQ